MFLHVLALKVSAQSFRYISSVAAWLDKGLVLKGVTHQTLTLDLLKESRVFLTLCVHVILESCHHAEPAGHRVIQALPRHQVDTSRVQTHEQLLLALKIWAGQELEKGGEGGEARKNWGHCLKRGEVVVGLRGWGWGGGGFRKTRSGFKLWLKLWKS